MGRVSVPAFSRQVVERRSGTNLIFLGLHEVDPCLTAYDQGYNRFLFADNERRRVAEEGNNSRAHHSRDRRTFGNVEPISYDSTGRISLPPRMRKRGQIEDLALFVGTGGKFEIWNPQLALQSEDEGLRELAADLLEERGQ
jgi:MraZ protein